MCETIAKITVALIIVMTASLFIYQVKTTEKVERDHGPCVEEYKGYCLNGGDCFSYVGENVVGCLCPPLYGGKRCDKYLWWY